MFAKTFPTFLTVTLFVMGGSRRGCVKLYAFSLKGSKTIRWPAVIVNISRQNCSWSVETDIRGPLLLARYSNHKLSCIVCEVVMYFEISFLGWFRVTGGAKETHSVRSGTPMGNDWFGQLEQRMCPKIPSISLDQGWDFRGLDRRKHDQQLSAILIIIIFLHS